LASDAKDRLLADHLLFETPLLVEFRHALVVEATTLQAFANPDLAGHLPFYLNAF
jgi:hypothetical protein